MNLHQLSNLKCIWNYSQDYNNNRESLLSTKFSSYRSCADLNISHSLRALEPQKITGLKHIFSSIQHAMRQSAAPLSVKYSSDPKSIYREKLPPDNLAALNIIKTSARWTVHIYRVWSDSVPSKPLIHSYNCQRSILFCSQTFSAMAADIDCYQYEIYHTEIRVMCCLTTIPW